MSLPRFQRGPFSALPFDVGRFPTSGESGLDVRRLLLPFPVLRLFRSAVRRLSAARRAERRGAGLSRGFGPAQEKQKMIESQAEYKTHHGDTKARRQTISSRVLSCGEKEEIEETDHVLCLRVLRGKSPLAVINNSVLSRGRFHFRHRPYRLRRPFSFRRRGWHSV